MKSFFTQAFFVFGIVCWANCAYPDHALLTNGKILYNVMVPDGITTGGQMVRIRTGSMSFGYDPRTNMVYTLPNHSVIDRVADYISTTTTVGRNKATAMVKRRRWDKYHPLPVTPKLVAPTPAPKATPLPPEILAAKAEVPLNVVSNKVPLDDRLSQQLDIFMKEQTTLIQDSTTSMARGLVTPAFVKNRKVGLLNQQQTILREYYPQSAETVKLAVNYWAEQIERATNTGRFDQENL